MSWLQRLQSLSWDPPGGLGWLFILLGVAAIAYAIFVYRRTEAPLTPGFKALLTGLRATFLLLILAILCRPVLSLAVPSGADRGVLVLLDRSLSMMLPGADGDETRLQELDRIRTLLAERLDGAYPFSMVPFGTRVGEPIGIAASLEDSLESSTEIALALEQGMTASDLEGRPGAVILVSDGTQTAGADPVPVARRLGVPVGTIPLGSSRPVNDLSLVRVRANREAFLGERTPLEAVVRLQGLEPGNVTVSLHDVTEEELELSRETVRMEPGGAEVRVPIAFEPGAVGLRFLEVRLDRMAGESTHENNRRLLAVSVREEKTGILVLSGLLTWDHTFLRRALSADSTLDVRAAAWRSGAFRGLAPGSDAPRLSETGLRGTRVVVLDHVSPSQLGADGVRALVGFARSGGGIVMLTGSRPDALTRWRGSPLEAVLPVTIGGSGAVREEQVRPGPGARRHVLFDPSAPGAAPFEFWSDLPPVSVASGLGDLKGHAEALLVATPSQSRAVPVLSWAPADQGRVLLLAGGGFWSWDFLSSAHRHSGNHMPSWWRRAVQWLAEPEVETRFDVHPDRVVVRRGEPIRFVARATDQVYRPLPDVDVNLEIVPEAAPDTEPVRLSLSGAEGFLSGSLPGLDPGRYVYRARAATAAEEIGQAEGRFAVDSLGAEMERLEADHELLARLAAETGGRFWNPDSLDAIAGELSLVAAGEDEREQLDLWDHPLTFALFVLVGSAEWILRRRRGLI